jgi:FixJ family two-component response regulator
LSKLIAIVDGEASIRQALERLLRTFGYETRSFQSGEDFLGSVHAAQPDCVILDLHMAGMNGVAVQSRLKECGLRVPVIMISGHDPLEAQATSDAAGSEAFIAKPLDGQLLAATIANVTGASTQHVES